MYHNVDWEKLEDWYDTSRPKHFIYALIDPRDNRVRYIGDSVNVANRVEGHFSNRDNPLIWKWVRELKSVGLMPKVQTLADCHGETYARFLEAVYIDEYQRYQGDLLNRSFLAAGSRKQEFDRAAERRLTEIKRSAREETKFYSGVAKRRAKRGTRVTFEA